MAVSRISSDKCIGCAVCVKICPMDVLRMDPVKHVPYAAYPEECMCCDNCEIECPVNAIYVTPEKYDPPVVAWK